MAASTAPTSDDPPSKEEQRLQETLAAIQKSVEKLQQEGKDKPAVELALQRLDLVRRYYGEPTVEYHEAKSLVAGLLLRSASVLLAFNDAPEVCDLLQHVDTMTKAPVPASVPYHRALDLRRFLHRVSMDKTLLHARHSQGRFSSSTALGRRLVQSVEGSHALWELPSAYLNLAATQSACGHHTEALGSAYGAYRAVAMTLCALSTKEDPASAACEYYKACIALEETPVARQRTSATANAQSDVAPSTHDDPSAAQHNDDPSKDDVAASGEPQDQEEICPSLEDSHEMILVCDELRKRSSHDGSWHELVDLAAEANLSTVLSDEGLSLTVRQRWGGLLALAYRTIACEQEHLGQTKSAVLTYRVGATTAEATVGPDHAVTRQCRAALNAVSATADNHDDGKPPRPALGSRHRGLPGRVPGASGVPIVATDLRRTTTPSSDQSHTRRSASPGLTVSSVAASSTEPRRSRIDATTKRSTSVSSVSRPLWNDWFSSQQPPPLHLEVRRLADAKHVQQEQHTPSRPTSSIPPRREPAAAADAARPPRRKARPPREQPLSSGSDERVLTNSDLQFLQQTYRLRRPGSLGGSANLRSASASSHHRRRLSPHSATLPPDSERYYALLDDHRRYAEELVEELGLSRS